MSTLSPLESALAQASVHVATVNESRDPDRFVKIESELDALGKQICGRAENLTYLPRFSEIQEQFIQAQEMHQKHSADRSGMGSRSVSYSSVGSKLPKRGASSAASRYSPPPAVLVGKGRPMPEATRVLGTINQYHDGDSLAGTFGRYNRVTCPSTSLSFISRFLNHGSAGLDSNMVDQLIRIGQDRFLGQVAQRREALREVAIPLELRGDVQGNMMAPTDVVQAFEEAVGPRPHSPASFFLADHSDVLEQKLSAALTKSLIPQAMQQVGGKLLVPIKANGLTFHILIEVTKDRVRTTLSTPEGKPIRGTESLAYNNARGIAGTAKAIVTRMTTETRRAQLTEKIIRPLVELATIDPHQRAASTITINGQTTAIGVDVSGPRVKVTLFDSHGNGRLNGSGEGFVYETEGAENAADILLRMMYVKDKEIVVQGAMSEAQRKFLAAEVGELNEVGTWLVLPKEHLVSFAEEAPVLAPVMGLGVAVEQHEELEEKEHKSSPSVVTTSAAVSQEAVVVNPLLSSYPPPRREVGMEQRDHLSPPLQQVMHEDRGSTVVERQREVQSPRVPAPLRRHSPSSQQRSNGSGDEGTTCVIS